ncbi:MAG: type II toxin-antitoxin system death-on-curing family toxin [Nitrospirae bacterium]|nr:type II toxin-antitoxin system death-on-curing family toxin [Candidatus Manganitrophaceae bacterium]
MKEILFLTVDQVIEVHADLIEEFGGSHGIRDLGLLQSAIAMPQAGFGDEYLHSNLFEMAAAYLFHLVQNHPFIDGNKRTAALSAFTFLKLNGHALKADEFSFEGIILDVAQGKIGKAAVAEFFRKNV